MESSINAGLDMVMIPYGPGRHNNYVEFIRDLKALVAEGKVPQAGLMTQSRGSCGSNIKWDCLMGIIRTRN